MNGDWTQTLTLMGVFVALFGTLAMMIIWMTAKLDSDIKSLGNRLDGHATRIDQLYRMFIDLLKDRK